jgi:hypothetical protein
MKNQFQFLLISFILLFSLSSFSQSILYVNGDLDHGGNGLTWPTAYKHLQDALYEAQNNTKITEIRVADGIYLPDIDESSHPNNTGDQNMRFTLRDNIALKGGYKGEGSNANDRDFELYKTILSGNINEINIDDDNTYTVIEINNCNEIYLEGLIIKKGYDGYGSGGGLSIRYSSSVIINNCTIEENYAGYGGGLRIGYSSSVIINNCTIEENTCGHIGGGIYISNSEIKVNNSYFHSNYSLGNGGALYITITNSENYNYSVDLVNCTYEENSSYSAGGAIHGITYNELNIINCVFIRNSSRIGGAIASLSRYGSEERKKNIINCTFFMNTANGGNSLVSSDGTYNEENHFVVTNSIFWNSDNNSSEILTANEKPEDVTFSNIKGGYDGIGNIDQDPQFVDPGNDFHLSAASPCINRGTNIVEGLPETDFEGDDRAICSFVDMGADEFIQKNCDIIYVNHAVNGGNGSGDTWANAKDNLHDAIVAAGEYYQIWVAQGTYKPSEPSSKSAKEYNDYMDKMEEMESQFSERFEGANSTKARPSFEEAMSDPRRNKFYIDKPLAIYGGFSGSGLETELDQRNWEDNVTILSGDIGEQDVNTDNCYRIVYIAADNAAILDGFTITKNWRQQFGFSPAILVYWDSGLFLENCLINDNYWAILISNWSNSIVRNCVISNNIHGISIINLCNASIQNSVIFNNSPTDSYLNRNIDAYVTDLNVENTLIINNESSSVGAAIQFNTGSQYSDSEYKLKIDNSTIANNISAEESGSIALVSQNNNKIICEIQNSIFWDENFQYDHIDAISFNKDNNQDLIDIDIQYTNVQMADPNELFEGIGNINEDPLFVDPDNGDFHLDSEVGYWTEDGFVEGTDCSPCIDAGDPDFLSEIEGNRVNMGAYGNTEQASWSCVKTNHQSAPKENITIEHENFANFSFQPNPFSSELIISCTEKLDCVSDISIYNINGQKVFETKLQISANIPAEIVWNGNDLLPGLYLIKYSNSFTTQTYKVVLQK